MTFLLKRYSWPLILACGRSGLIIVYSRDSYYINLMIRWENDLFLKRLTSISLAIFLSTIKIRPMALKYKEMVLWVIFKYFAITFLVFGDRLHPIILAIVRWSVTHAKITTFIFIELLGALCAFKSMLVVSFHKHLKRFRSFFIQIQQNHLVRN